ncbi:hypothetical protein FPZ12_023970 [Amycolatopsis acidicola]|uniref:Putative T7SS secretion signal domain-containing protein n=1 Tax=Amycolatopsis acidicola TaxID=2596893 RepID=A0A5N0UYJ9_9PSEU|nr:hypothetical protein [Amycolatopsis acidicola]KAA9157944.1 hypothetical protein FPZ12_023970 [Amycolatopsis acidicola]
MAELGETQDSTELVKGKPDAIEENVRVLRARADRAGRASEGLKAIDTGAWQGPAARAFHDKFSYEPSKWYEAADSLLSAADALDQYASTLRWSQGQAVEAIALWNRGQAATRQAQAQHEQATGQATANGQAPLQFTDPGTGTRQAAQDTLARARGQLAEVGDAVADAIKDATSAAPQESSWIDDAGNFVADAGGHLVNGLASFGNAVINHPGELATIAMGFLGMAAGAGGEALGTVLDATGVGAAAGVPLQAASAGLIASGATAATAGAAQLAMHAAGDDHVSPMQTNHSSGAGAESEPPFQPPKQINGKTAHGEQQMAERNGHGVNDAAAHDAVANPVKPPKYRPDNYGGTYRYTGRDAVVNLHEQGQVTTAWARSRAGWRHE